MSGGRRDERVQWWYELHGDLTYRDTRDEALRDLDACLRAYEEDSGNWAVGVSATLLVGEGGERSGDPEDPAAVLASSDGEPERCRKLVEALRNLVDDYDPDLWTVSEAVARALAEYEGG